MARTYELPAENLHYVWDNRIAPVLTIQPGDTVVFNTLHCYGDAFSRDSTLADFANFKRDPAKPGHALTGPVFIEGAEPGDVLAIEVLNIETADWGFTSFRAGSGLLPATDFPDPFWHVWDLPQGQDYAEFKPGIRVPLAPFCGVMGVALPEAGQHSTIPPRRFGGNLDVKQLCKGATLYLPVGVTGGLFSTGDCHAAQGDGEVCVTAIECDGQQTFRFDLIKSASFATPRIRTAQPATRGGEAGYFIISVPGDDLHAASQEAIRQMIAYLVADKGLTGAEAYALCSVSVDLKISEVVNRPNWVVSAFLPNSIFV